MFGMGGSEIIVILIIALLFLGPDKLPEAAKQISQAVRGIRKQTRELQTTIENDSQIGGAIRDIKSALRGDEPRARPPVRKEPPAVPAPAGEAVLPAGAAAAATAAELGAAETAPLDEVATAAAAVTLPARAGEVDPPDASDDEPGGEPDDGDLSALIRPATGTVAKGAAPAEPAATQDDKAS